MTNCTLCLEIIENTRLHPLNDKINATQSIKDAIKYQFMDYEVILASSSSQSICQKCLEAFKSFYDFTSFINSKHSIQIKIEEDENSLKIVWDEQVDFKDVGNNGLLPINVTAECVKTEPLVSFISEDTLVDENSYNEAKEDDEWNSSDSDKNSSSNFSDMPVKRLRGSKKIIEVKPNRNLTGDARIRQFIEIKCNECDLKIDSFNLLGKHFKKTHPGVLQYLLCCGKKYHRRCQLIDHIDYKHEHSNEQFPCEICKKKYKTQKVLKHHIKNIHEKETKRSEDSNSWVCPECGKVLRSQGSFKNHMFTHQEDPEKTFECYKCQKNQYKNAYLLRHHFYAKHNKERPKKIPCKICSVLVTASHMSNHVKFKHNSEPLVREKCSICDHWILKNNMKFHLSKHSDEGVNCHECGKFLKSKHSLAVHINLVHKPVSKNFKCDYCQKAFHREKKLIEHRAAVHTREFLYKCRVPGCAREYRAEGNWKMHEKRSHPYEYDRIFKPFWKRNPNEPAPNIEAELLNLNKAHLSGLINNSG